MQLIKAPSQFDVIPVKQQLREKWGIPPNQYVVISVASVDEPFKRLQFLFIDSVYHCTMNLFYHLNQI